jgi:purine-binding chemotaxis protein CheW
MVQETSAQLLVFRLDQHRYALPLAATERVVQSVAITPLPDAPTTVLGVIDVAGQVRPVFDVRRRCGLPLREVGIFDHLLLARCARGPVALVIDAADGVVTVPAASIVDACAVTARDSTIAGVVQLGQLVLIHDLDRFLSSDEALRLDRALQGAATT